MTKRELIRRLEKLNEKYADKRRVLIGDVECQVVCNVFADHNAHALQKVIAISNAIDRLKKTHPAWADMRREMKNRKRAD